MTITIQELNEFFTFDPDSGIFRWKDAPGNTRKIAGDEAGHIRSSDGYYELSILNRRVRAHRAAWAMHYGEWPERSIDHINRVKTDNRICNLRLCSDSDNRANIDMPSNNKSGAKGVCWHKQAKAWQAQIKVRGRYLYLGLFDSVDAASRAYRERAIQEFGEFSSEFGALK